MKKKWSSYVNFFLKSDFDKEYNGTEDILEEMFPNHESFSENDTESEEDNILEMKKGITRNGFHQNMAYRTTFRQKFVLVVKILCRAYLEQKGQRKKRKSM
ncbi:hypothetical protein AVEN_227771-1 [Araneus ventricosus]|uniref:Uncharacterized protein n=1 Tax=Araneus ventricosus TaxID=182803 RepID=A0A4Y2IUQ9_ARAVE|nr:hypothetical protein AVEN_227771-1 [Araneus ventricosus]